MATTATTPTHVEDAMHEGVLACSRETPLLDVALVLEHGTGHLVVVDPTDLRPAGVLSTPDVAAAVGESMRLETMSS